MVSHLTMVYGRYNYDITNINHYGLLWLFNYGLWYLTMVYGKYLFIQNGDPKIALRCLMFVADFYGLQ